MYTENAFGNLKNRYKAVLKKCNLLNAFGSLAIVASVLCGTPAFAETPDVTVTTEEYIESSAGNYYTTYEVTIYDITNQTYITTKYGVLIKGDNTYYIDISALTRGLILGTTPENDAFDSISTEGSSDYSFTVDGVKYYVVGAIQTSNRKDSLTTDVTENFIGLATTTAYGGAIYNTSNDASIDITGYFIGNSISYVYEFSTYGGAIYNTGTLGDIIGSFIGNYASTTGGDASGGAIYNNSSATIGDITGSFIGNYAYTTLSNAYAYGGAIYNTGTISSIIGSFIGNYAYTTEGSSPANGGAIYNSGSSASITSITGSFIGNYASASETAFGGAIYNSGTLGNITASFIGNYASGYNEASGGAIYNTGTISSITGSFIGNYASSSSSSSSGAYGGAIYNATNAKLDSITGSFIGNYASSRTSGTSQAFGGAIYNTGTISSISGSFIGNYASSSTSGTSKALGGAIYNDNTYGSGNLTFLANNETHIFTDNYTTTDNGTTKDYNFIASYGGELTFKMTGTGGFILNDSIVAVSEFGTTKQYTLTITGEDKSKNNFYLNAGISGVSEFSITNATLYMGSYLHADGTTRTYGSISASGSLEIGDLIADVSYYDYETYGALLEGNGSATLTVADNSTVTLVNASVGKTYTIAENFAIGSTLWSTENIILETSLFEAIVSGTAIGNDAYKVTVGLNTNNSLYDGPAGTLLGNVANHDDYGADANQADLSFVYNATNTNNVGSTHKQGAIIEGNAQQATAAGTNANSYAVNRTATDVLHGRHSSLNNSGVNTSYSAMNVVTRNEDGTIKAEYDGVIQVAGATDNLLQNQNSQNSIDIWAMPMFAHENVKGMSAGSYSSDYKTDLYGVTVGIDKTIRGYGVADAYRLGLAFNVGSGQTTTSGDFDNMTNDFDFFGLTAYGAMQFGDFTLSTDFGYTKNKSDIKQDLSSYSMDNTYSNVDSDVWHLALHGEYVYKMDSLHIVPYVGLDFITMKTDDYSVKNIKGTVYEIESERQNIVSVPVGVRIEKEIETENGWHVIPEAKIGAIFSAGDLDAHSTARMPSVDDVANMSTQVVDKATFDVGLGVSMAKDNLRFALEYDLQVSQNRTSHGVMGIVEFKF